MITTLQLNVKTKINYLRLTNTYYPNKKVLGHESYKLGKKKKEKKRKIKKKLTFPAVFMTDLISLLHAFRDFIWI